MPLTITREDIPIRRLASGAQLTIPVFRVAGTAPGKKVYLQANIHGPEIAGIGALHRLLDILRTQEVLNGTLVIVPSVNPVGLDSKINGRQVGYSDLNETIVGNFNRIYQMPVTDTAPDDPDGTRRVALDTFVATHRHSDLATIKQAFRHALKAALDDIAARHQPYGPTHGQKLAAIIQDLAYDADCLIDLHTAGRAAYHMFTFVECLSSVPYFGLKYTVQLGRSFDGVLDEAILQPWLRLRDALAAAGRDIPFADFELEAFTPELGSADMLDAVRMDEDAARIVNYLRYKGVLAGDVQSPSGEYLTCTQAQYRRYRAPTGGLLTWHKHPGDTVTAGEPLVTIVCAYNHLTDSPAERTVLAVEDGIVLNCTDTYVVHEGMGLCSVMTSVTRYA